MKSGEFAKLCDTSKDTLIHYDQIGLVKPSSKKANGYRDYTMDDYGVFVTIRALVDAGMSLAEIKERCDKDDLLLFHNTVKETQEAILQRIRELERSKELLAEIARQSEKAVQDGLEAEGVVDVRVKHLPERLLLVDGPAQVKHPGDSFELLWPALGKAMMLTKSIGPAAQLSPYGLTANFVDGKPLYQSSYLLLPQGIEIPEDALEEVSRNEFKIDTKPEGDYVVVIFNEEWPEVGKAYKAARRFVQRENLILEEPYYETASLWFLDHGEKDRFRCTLSIRIAG
ncbi:MerR family transcriptional regulator [Adlercreutzia sp. ZJ473]|uniref:MerR family transcriptional regulator n=1 Tax=Adlercreutzia sp. ZJ473 TaxID=2722822 RepID=UPI00155464B4|nr:MerR family transcriptional regulator [Adlercreutzia sp. ZJ473]